jgi:hypothetical protein
LEYGARLDVENADGETVLENATHWDLVKGDGPLNVAPILLRLQKECEVASKGGVYSMPDPGPLDTILDLLDFPKEIAFNVARSKLKILLANLVQGYGYASKIGNVSPDSSTYSLSNNSTHITALKAESTSRPGSSLSDTGVGLSAG